jgi:L-idonate 5-dehydrogenase
MDTELLTPKINVGINTMVAAVLYGAKDLRIETISKPVLMPGMVLLKVKRAGICGSDLYYYKDGYCGNFVPSKPFVLGHELTAEIVETNNDNGLPIGTRVTVNPARACGVCEYCQSGRKNLCKSTIMLGSGSTVPPTNGAFAQYVAVRADQCFELPNNMSDGEGAMIEPLAVGLQAIKQSGTVEGKKVLITGGGVIGLLTAVAAKALGASIVAVSDIVEERRNTALELNVDAVFDPTSKDLSNEVNKLTTDGFDIIYEASGARQALRQSFDLVKSGGTIVQIGTIGVEDVPLPANLIMVKEIKFIGSFRYADIFDEAINLVAFGKIDVKPFITSLFALKEADNAMRIALDKANELKVQIEI